MKSLFYAETSTVFPGIVTRNKGILDYENFIHRTFYPYIIHPYSRFKVYWDFFIIIFHPIKLTIFFFMWAFLSHTHILYQVWILLMQMINLSNIVLSFFMGYVENRTEIIVLSPKRIAVKYILSTFFLDVLSCVPCEFFMYFYNPHCISVSALMIRERCHLIEFSTVVSIFCESGSFYRSFKNIAKVMFWNPYFPSLIAMSYFFCIIVIYNFTFLFALAFTSNEGMQANSLSEEFEYFLKILINFAFDVLFLSTNFPGMDSSVQIPLLIFTFFFSVCFAAYFIKYATGKMRARERFFFLQSRVKSFAKKKNLPMTLKQKTLLYFQILLQNKYHKDDELFNYVPDSFKADMFFHFTLPLLKGFHAFEDFPIYVLKQIAECLKYQLHLPNELVMTKNEITLCMYFIQRGTVALYSSKQIELYHFEAGSSINGRIFIEGKPPTSHFAISTEVTEVWRLEHDDFMEVMSAYPKLLSRMKEKLVTKKKESHDFIETVF